jgi:RNA polymerase sigma-70 factor, ECF subfamily
MPTEEAAPAYYMPMRELEPGTAGSPIGLEPSRLRLEALWAELRPRLETYLHSFGSLDRDEREDILQEVLFKMWRNEKELTADARAWAYRVTRNAALDALRTRQRKRERSIDPPRGEGDRPQTDGDVASLPSHYPRPLDELIGAEEEAFVTAFLSGLDDHEREILHLAFAEDFSYPEVARLIGRPLGTVKWRIAGLKKRLAARYEKEFG